MNKSKQTINESLDKIKFMMNYDSSRTLLENEDLLDEQYAAMGGMGATTMGSINNTDVYNLNGYVRKLHRNVQRVEGVFKELEGKKFKGGDAITALKTAYKEKYGVDLPSTVTGGVSQSGQPGQPGQAGAQQQTFRPAQGTPEDPYVVGTTGEGVGKVQQYLGGLKVDNMFGPKTKAKLAEKVPQFAEKFTNNDLMTIYKTLYPQAPIEKIAAKPAMPNLGAQVNSTQLAGQQKPQQNLAYNTNTTAAKGV
jgi:hypothetical protein